MIKKILTFLVVFSLIAPQITLGANIGKATIFNPITGHRKEIVIGQKFDKGYLLEVNYKDEQKLGFGVVSDYKTSLFSPMSSTQNTIPVSSVRTTDGHTLTMSDFGSKVFLTLEPGGIKQEIVMCTGISGTSWTGCTRGLAFYGSSTVSVTANRKTHSAGISVIISNVHYVYQEFLNTDDNQTFSGNKNFTGNVDFSNLPTTTSTAPTLDGQVATKKYVDDTSVAGAPDATDSVKGISELATGQEAASSTLTGGTGARLVLPTSITTSTAGTAYTVPVTGSNGRISSGFYQANDNTWSGLNAFSGTTTMATTSVTILSIGATSTATLVGGATSTLHFHPNTVGYFTKVMDNASYTGTTTITHNLGVIPSTFTVHGVTAVTTNRSLTTSIYSKGSVVSLYSTNNGAGAVYDISSASTTFINMSDPSSPGTSNQIGALTIDSTTATIVWRKTGTPAGQNAYFIWEARQ